MLAALHGADAAFDAAIAEDPDFAMAHIGRARVHQLNMEGAEARGKATTARQLVAAASPRERQHIEIMASVIESQPKKAMTAAEQHLTEYPRDAQVLSLLLGAFGLYAFSGRADHDAARLAVCEHYARDYGEDWWFLTYLGWSQTEAGQIVSGRAITERGYALKPENAGAAHAVAHALFEQGNGHEGRAFLSAWLTANERTSFLQGHLAWHLALIDLEEGDADAALDIYERHIKPAGRPYPPLNIYTDTASLLWRLALAGKTDLASHWKDVAAYGDSHFPKAGAHFADVHHALVAATTNGDALERRLAEMEARQADGKLAPGPSAIGLCRGIAAFAAGDHNEAVRILAPLMPELVRIGGSHAQRELWEDTFIVACLRAGQGRQAVNLISDRLHRRPSRRDLAWSQEVARQ
ncbi:MULTISPECIES: tetratricopeptide repeat protein [unclassified Bradyrhizobium]|uniref:tetratricopeptide repeat protein n=1 Tax=unclassified Bradyrhizobium TaxID=2631580 RepID=UPI00247A1331|nr:MULTISPECIES: tetratricopeptide repeat protein [unclassified Bradyrhizobium]WGS24109.1 tetratricopeptide repeat protein [Bradyrhizobium sp. ISRA463]WGS31416.1 tetratricopeptide repeat protein [Bradyrhizobium sp. ISRA464]